jgi:hypothetical protein
MNIQFFFTGWLLSVIGLCFIRLKWAVALFMGYLILVPYINLGIPGLGSGDNLIKLILVFGFYLNHKKQSSSVSFKPFIPFIIYFVVSLIMIPFQSNVPMGEMLDSWRQDVMNILFFPIVMYNLMRLDPSCVSLLRNTMIVCVFIAIGYGLFLTLLGGFNPYIMYFLTMIDTDIDFERYYEASGGGRLFGRISSVFVHPMTFALFIGLSFVYVFYILKDIWKVLSVALFVAIGIMAILCGVRSVIGGMIVAAAYYFFISKNYRLMAGTILVVIIGQLIISTIPELSDYLSSIVDVKNNSDAVRGSSIEMRMTQLEGAIDEAAANPFFGLGYGWTVYYQNNFGEHPICLCFESLLFVVICNSGIIGLLLWIYMVWYYININNYLQLKQVVVVNALIVFYVSYSFITGEYSYMKIFLIFYTLMLGESIDSLLEFSQQKEMEDVTKIDDVTQLTERPITDNQYF